MCYIVESLMYKWSSLLITVEPELTVQLLIAKVSCLQTHLLLPALMRYCDKYDSFSAPSVSKGSAKKGSNTTTSSNSSTDSPPSEHCGIQFLYYYFHVHLYQYYRRLDHASTTNSTPISVIRTPTEASLFHSYIWMLCKYGANDESLLVEALSIDHDLLHCPLPFTPTTTPTPTPTSTIPTHTLTKAPSSLVDYNFILRQCIKYHRNYGVILSYLYMDFLSDALEVAMPFNFDLAMVSFHTTTVIHILININYTYIPLCT